MIKMKANVNFNQKKLLAKSEKAVKAAQMQLDEDVLKDSNYFVPQDSGNLQSSGVVSSKIGSGVIRWVAKYARKLYYNPQYNFSKDKNPNASGLWFEHAKTQNKKKWLQSAKKAFKKSFGG